MHNARRISALLALAASALIVSAAQASPKQELSPVTPSVKWTSAPATGLNATWFVDSLKPTGQCGADVYDFCDETLVHFTTPLLAEGTQLKFRIDNFNPAPSDFDLRVYESDATGAADAYLGSPKGDVTTTSPLGANDPRATAAGDFETKIVDPSGNVDDNGAVDAYYLVRVPYFTVANGTYDGSVSILTP